MDSAMPKVCWFEECNKNSVAMVGGKCSSLGELINAGVRVPPGFALTTHGYAQFMREAGIQPEVSGLLKGLDHEDMDKLEEASVAIREMIESRPVSIELEDLVAESYRKLSVRCGVPAVPVAVRSSATAEDLPGASFAGQQDTYLWIRGIDGVMHHVRRCISSLYTGRAIAYRVKMGFPHEQVAISVGIQKMANSYSAGVMFTIDTESGFEDVVFITSSYGLGETVVQGAVNPDEFYVHKPMLKAGKQAVIRRNLGSKLIQMVFTTPEEKAEGALKGKLIKTVDVPTELRNRYSLTDADVQQLAHYALVIEQHYGRPMDIEWGKDGNDGKLYILQARPETVKSRASANVLRRYLEIIDDLERALLDLADKHMVLIDTVGMSQRDRAVSEQIVTKAKAAAVLEHTRLQAELRRDVGRLVVKTAQQVTGKMLSAEDQERLIADTNRSLAA